MAPASRKGRLVNFAGKMPACWCEWRAVRSRIQTHLIGDDCAPIARLAPRISCTRGAHQHGQARAMWATSHPVVVGFPEYP